MWKANVWRNSWIRTLMPSSSLTLRIILTHISVILLKAGCSRQMSLRILITRFLTLMPVSCSHTHAHTNLFSQTQGLENQCHWQPIRPFGAITYYQPPGGSRRLNRGLNFPWTQLNIPMTTATTISMSSLLTCSGQRQSTVFVCWTAALTHMAWSQLTLNSIRETSLYSCLPFHLP